MIAAYTLIGQDCGSRFFKNAPTELFCRECGTCLEEGFFPDNITVQKKLDVGSTYDGRIIVSSKAHDLILRSNYGNINFTPVTHDKSYFVINIDNILEVDQFSSGVENGVICPSCNLPIETIIRGTLSLKNIFSPIVDGIFKTDIVFGSRASKSPDIIIGVNTKILFLREHLKGAIFLPVLAQRAKPIKRYN